jgi:hypothetical protein
MKDDNESSFFLTVTQDMMNNNKITINKEFDLNYGLDQIKHNIKKLYTENVYKMKYTYMLQKEMDSLNYFRISKMNGLVVVIWDINLKRIDDENTKIELVCLIDTHTNSIAMSTLNSFLERLMMLLEGKEDTEIIESTNKGCLGLLIVLFVGLSVLYNLTGCQKGGEDKLKKEMKVVMESYIDSVEDDFGSYDFENIYLDTMFWSDLLYWRFSDRTEYSNFVLREEYKKKYDDRLKLLIDYPIMGEIDGNSTLSELFRKNYIKFDSMCNQDNKNWYNMKLNSDNDSIQYIRLRLHYKINNKYNSIIKKTCSFSVRSGKILSRYIEDGYLVRDSMIGIGRKHFMDK